MLRRAESGEWDPCGRHPAEIAAYLASVARNALQPHTEQARRLMPLVARREFEDARTPDLADPHAPAVEARAEVAEFVDRPRECLLGPQPRSRRSWFFRVLLGMSSRDIARHPDIELNAAHVDVIVKRARDIVHTCLATFGFEAGDLPPGAFTRLWDGIRALDVDGLGSTGHEHELGTHQDDDHCVDLANDLRPPHERAAALAHAAACPACESRLRAAVAAHERPRARRGRIVGTRRRAIADVVPPAQAPRRWLAVAAACLLLA